MKLARTPRVDFAPSAPYGYRYLPSPPDALVLADTSGAPALWLQVQAGSGWVPPTDPNDRLIVVTAYPSIDSALTCLRARSYDYLTKPFPIMQLQKTVMRCLEGRGLLRMSEAALRESLGNAIRERRKMAISYRDEKGSTTARTIWPIAMVYYVDVTLIERTHLRERRYRRGEGCGAQRERGEDGSEHDHLRCSESK